MASTRAPAADFDMAKLQKSLKQRQRHSIQARPHVAKLTPAEIRSLNHGAHASITDGSMNSTDSSRPELTRTKTATPPLTPENTSAYYEQLKRTTTAGLPTPPRSPDKVNQRSAQSSLPNGQSHIYAPRPSRASVQADFMIAQATSRPCSQTSYRGLPTYRGHEVTRTGSLTMLQHPDQNIVTNPLSNFSRPRQRANASPVRCNHDEADGGGAAYRTQSLRNQRSHSVDSIQSTSDMVQNNPGKPDVRGQAVEPQPVDSFPAFDGAHNEIPDAVNPPSHNIKLEEARKAEASKVRRKSLDTQSSTKKTSFLDNVRRRTWSLPKADDNTKTGLKSETPSQQHHTVDGTMLESPQPEFEAHPAIRPLSVIIPDTDTKGKGRDIQSAPVIGRCSCCGKLKRPGFTSGLSPVMENENLRSNFSFEMDRDSSHESRRHSSSSRSKYTPIIPMPVREKNIIRQASIESMPKMLNPHPSHSGISGSLPTSNRPSMSDSDYMSSGALPSDATTRSSVSEDTLSHAPISRALAPPAHRITRFASLHGLRQDSATDGDSSVSRQSIEVGRSSNTFSIHEAVTSPHPSPRASKPPREQRPEKSVMFIAESKPVLYKQRRSEPALENRPPESSRPNDILSGPHFQVTQHKPTAPPLNTATDYQSAMDYQKLFSPGFMESPSLELSPTGSISSRTTSRNAIAVGGK